MVTIRRALLSVSDKSGILPLARALVARNVEIISTGGTAKALAAEGIPVTPIERVTNFPEMMDGRVKTLHPVIHGGLLALRDNPEHVAAMHSHGIRPIDLVCVNLYPFEKTVAPAAGKPAPAEHEAIEQIDIGGPSMVRSASKNFDHVAVLTSPDQYSAFLDEFAAHQGATTRELRRRLATEAFARTSAYDAAITSYLASTAAESGNAAASAFPQQLRLEFYKAAELRCGENPHQAAALYRAPTQPSQPTIAHAAQLYGKDLGYNNINDADAALALALTLHHVAGANAAFPRVAACVIKHANPCGAALAASAAAAIDSAIASDPVAAYGGIVAVSAEVDAASAERLCRKDVFMEVIVAPSFAPAALEQLKARWQNVRLLATGAFSHAQIATARHEYRTIAGGLLAQERDARLASPDELVHRAGPAPTPEQLLLAAFLEPVCRALLSNAVCIGGMSASGPMLLGAGAGQMDRLTSCRLAVEKAGARVHSCGAAGAIAFSDAFFPFPDGPEILINAGVKLIVHPGGAKRDQETFDLCTARNVTCLTNNLRHFRH